MAKTPELQRFYGTKAWQDLRWKKIIEAGGKCERCGKDFTDDMSQLIAHHKEHLTDENLTDPFVALNPDNVEIVCRKCHAHYHDDRGYIKPRKQVFIVYGPPLSGKTTYVRQNAEPGDLIIDMDALYTAVSFEDLYTRPPELNRIVFGMRDWLYDQVRIRNGNWITAWIIAGLPRKGEREQLAARLGASCVLIECDKEECHKRLLNAEDGRFPQWGEYIDKWFADYTH